MVIQFFLIWASQQQSPQNNTCNFNDLKPSHQNPKQVQETHKPSQWYVISSVSKPSWARVKSP